MADFINPLVTLIASFSGAWAAFKLQSLEKSRDLHRANLAAANRTIMTMVQQANDLKLYQRDHIDPLRDHPGRHLGIQAILPFQENGLRFDFKSLDFLSTAEEHQMLFDLWIEENRYAEALKAINARSTLLTTVVQPKLMSHGFNDATEYTSIQYQAALGQPIYSQLLRLTDDVIYHVDRTAESICTMKDRFRALLLKRYPKEKLLNFEFPEPTKPVP